MCYSGIRQGLSALYFFGPVLNVSWPSAVVRIGNIMYNMNTPTPWWWWSIIEISDKPGKSWCCNKPQYSVIPRSHDDAKTQERFPHYCLFVRGTTARQRILLTKGTVMWQAFLCHGSPVDFPHKGTLTRSFHVFLASTSCLPNRELLVIWDTMPLLWRGCNANYDLITWCPYIFTKLD